MDRWRQRRAARMVPIGTNDHGINGGAGASGVSVDNAVLGHSIRAVAAEMAAASRVSRSAVAGNAVAFVAADGAHSAASCLSRARPSSCSATKRR